MLHSAWSLFSSFFIFLFCEELQIFTSTSDVIKCGIISFTVWILLLFLKGGKNNVIIELIYFFFGELLLIFFIICKYNLYKYYRYSTKFDQVTLLMMGKLEALEAFTVWGPVWSSPNTPYLPCQCWLSKEACRYILQHLVKGHWPCVEHVGLRHRIRT